MRSIINRLFSTEALTPKERLGEVPSSREAYGVLFRYALPSVCEMVLAALIGMIDTMMVSTIGTDAVAAVGLVGQPRMLFLSVFMAMNIGVTAVVARRKGENRRKDANVTLKNALVITMAMAIVLAVAAWFFAVPVLRFSGAIPGETLEDAVDYFRILMVALPVNALSMCICAAQRGIGNTKLTMYVNVISNLVNVLFNWLLINGVWFFPKMGVRGAALATVIGMCVGTLLCIVSLFNSKKHVSFLCFQRGDSWKFDSEALRAFSKVGGSAFAEQVAMRFGFIFYAKIVADLGTDAFAAHQIASQYLSLSFCFADGLGIAGTSLVGQMLGRRRPDLAHMFAKLTQRVALVLAVLIATCVVTLRYPLIGFFIHSDASEAVERMAVILMYMVGLFQLFQTSSVVLLGALRGAGDTKFVARISLACIAILRPALAYIAVYIIGTRLGYQEYALMGAWLASIIDIGTRLFLAGRRFNGGKWHEIKV